MKFTVFNGIVCVSSVVSVSFLLKYLKQFGFRHCRSGSVSLDIFELLPDIYKLLLGVVLVVL